MFSLSQPFGAACEQIVKAHTVSADAANTRGAAGVINASLMCTNERLLDEAARFHRLFPLMAHQRSGDTPHLSPLSGV